MVEKNTIKISKDTPKRSVGKAVSWRILASVATFFISFIVFKQYTSKTNTEVFQTAIIITIAEVIVKLILYYLHERIWTNINWGKQ